MVGDEVVEVVDLDFVGMERGGPLAHALGGCDNCCRAATLVVAVDAIADMYAGLIGLRVTRRGCGKLGNTVWN